MKTLTKFLLLTLSFLSVGFAKFNPNSGDKTKVYYSFGGLDLQLFANTNVDALYPEFWAMGFDMVDEGQYNLQNQIMRDFEPTLANFGDTVNVPLPPSFDAGDWTPGDAISPTATTQSTVALVLNKSKSVPFNLTGKELSLSPYRLIEEWGKPAIEAILAQLNTDIYTEMIASQYLTDATSSLTESKVVDAGTALSTRKISTSNRKIVAAPDDIGTLMKLANFSQANITNTTDVISDGKITRRYGFDFYENNAISKYTPTDLLGAVNLLAGYAAGTTTIAVDAFNDDTNPVRKGDVFTFANHATQYTVQSTTTTSSDTTGITFLPALTDAIVDNEVITVVATRSMLAFVPQAATLAARAYMTFPGSVGVQTSVIEYKGIPVRISVFHDGKLGLTVQYDILYGIKIIKSSRIQRILTA